jgi:hypothetical protein
MMGQLEKLSSKSIIFITLSSASAHRCSAIYQLQQLVEVCGAKTIFLSQTDIHWAFFIQF